MAEELQSQSQACSSSSLKRVNKKEGTRLWGEDWSAQVSPVTSSPLSGSQWLLTTGKVNQCHSRAGGYCAAEEGSGTC